MATTVTVSDDDDNAEFAPPPASMRSLIENLAVGESYARAARFDADYVLKDALYQAVRGMRLSTQPTVWRIKKTTGYEYKIEEGEVRTASRDIILVLVVTRTA